MTLSLAEAFELEQGRYPIRAEHLRGTDSLGCDLISVGSKAVQEEALRKKQVASDLVLRFIEVKGRSDRTSVVGLTENERDAAVILGERYFIYRMYRDAVDGGYELAILGDPTESASESARLVYEYSLSAGSGAEWYQVMELAETTTPESETAPSDIDAHPS